MANVEHSTLTGSDLHEPKGVAAAAANRIYLSNGAGSGSWTTVPAAAITAAGVLVFQSQKYHIRDERSSGTAADTLTASSWNTRALNTEKIDDLTITPASNQLSLAAGTYLVIAAAQVWFDLFSGANHVLTAESKLRLRNISDSTTALVGQGSHYFVQPNGYNYEPDVVQYDHLYGQFTIAGTKVVELQHWVTANATSSTIKGGYPVSSGENEVYLDLMIWKLS